MANMKLKIIKVMTIDADDDLDGNHEVDDDGWSDDHKCWWWSWWQTWSWWWSSSQSSFWCSIEKNWAIVVLSTWLCLGKQITKCLLLLRFPRFVPTLAEPITYKQLINNRITWNNILMNQIPYYQMFAFPSSKICSYILRNQ